MPETAFEKIMNDIGDSLSALARTYKGRDGEDKDDDEDDPDLGRLRDYDEPRWVMGTISETVHGCI